MPLRKGVMSTLSAGVSGNFGGSDLAKKAQENPTARWQSSAQALARCWSAF